MDTCSHCHQEFPACRDRCPHCGHDAGFPNVRQCSTAEEKEGLKIRYERAMKDAQSRGCGDNVRDFEEAVAFDSKAVINRSVGETIRLATDTNELYANYYQLIEAEVRLPRGDEWDKWRRTAEEAILPGYKEHISFATLSLTASGPPHYGPCSWICRAEMISNRATVFEENCVVFMWRFTFKDAATLPTGYRALWQERGKLAVAKLASKIELATPVSRFPGLLLAPGSTPEKDDFIEVHICETLSILSLEEVVLPKAARRSKTALRALERKLGDLGVRLSVV